MRINAKANPTSEDKTRPTMTPPATAPKTRMAESAVKVGSVSVKSVLLAKLVLDIANTTSDRIGITAKNPTIMAKPGKTKSGTTNARIEDPRNTITQVDIVNSEKARHLLR
jgi:hypothetical protein